MLKGYHRFPAMRDYWSSAVDKLYSQTIDISLNEIYKRLRLVNMSVVESMIRFKGQSSPKQYNLMKPIIRGYNVWCLADMTGYISIFNIIYILVTQQPLPVEPYG